MGILLCYTCCSATDYQREYFKHWTDLDNNGFDSRTDTLLSQQIAPSIWVCPYTGMIIRSSSKMDIDHIVPLRYAWEHGAESWDDTQRELFANDPDNLMAVSYSPNRSKGYRGPTEYLPPNITYIPIYIDKFTHVCEKYNLSCEFYQFKILRDCFLDERNGLKGENVYGHNACTSN